MLTSLASLQKSCDLQLALGRVIPPPPKHIFAGKRTMKNELTTKVGSENFSNNFSNNSVDIFGIGKATEAVGSTVGKILDYKKFKIEITAENKESLYHLLKKDGLTNNPKIKNFLEKIFKFYSTGGKISMQAIKIIEYLDDEILEALIHLSSKIVKDGEELYLPGLQGKDGLLANMLLRNQFLQRTFFSIVRAYDVPPAIIEILDLYHNI